ncbi:MAG: galactosyltransferase-related protein [Alphaproteobacteria bacterium]
MKISFTTTCMGRIEHLKQTLVENMRGNPSSQDIDVEFCVLDYNSPDGLEEWIKSDPQMVDAMEAGFLRYGKNHDVEKFHMAHAKNQAKRLATGEVLCNIDADNFTGDGFANYLANVFKKNDQIVVSPSSHTIGELKGGVGGRIAVKREYFEMLGGYDERFKMWGNEDTDFVRRAKGAGLTNYHIDGHQWLRYIDHDNFARIKNMVDERDWGKEIASVERTKEGSTPLQKLMILFKASVCSIQVNDGGKFGMGRVMVGLDDELVEFGELPVNKISPVHICAEHWPEFVIGRLLPERRSIESLYGNDDHGLHI